MKAKFILNQIWTFDWRQKYQFQGRTEYYTIILMKVGNMIQWAQLTIEGREMQQLFFEITSDVALF